VLREGVCACERAYERACMRVCSSDRHAERGWTEAGWAHSRCRCAAAGLAQSWCSCRTGGEEAVVASALCEEVLGRELRIERVSVRCRVGRDRPISVAHARTACLFAVRLRTRASAGACAREW
jgi:hypothetical protein